MKSRYGKTLVRLSLLDMYIYTISLLFKFMIAIFLIFYLYTTKTVALFISTNLRNPVIKLTLTNNNKNVHSLNTAKYFIILLDNKLSKKSH